jgi:hypothetical protein
MQGVDMREYVDPRAAAPDVGLALQQARMRRFAVAPRDAADDEATERDRLRRRDQLLHSLEMSRRLRRRRLLVRVV